VYCPQTESSIEKKKTNIVDNREQQTIRFRHPSSVGLSTSRLDAFRAVCALFASFLTARYLGSQQTLSQGITEVSTVKICTNQVREESQGHDGKFLAQCMACTRVTRSAWDPGQYAPDVTAVQVTGMFRHRGSTPPRVSQPRGSGSHEHPEPSQLSGMRALFTNHSVCVARKGKRAMELSIRPPVDDHCGGDPRCC
jgi:hypothetical protein